MSVIGVFSQKYQTKSGKISFESKAQKESFKAENRKVVSTIDSATGKIDFVLLMKAFDFPNDLMESHFNEHYAESTKFPKASFSGQIQDWSKVDLKKNGTYTVTVKGKLTIKDVTKEITTTAKITVKGNTITAEANLDIKPKDYNFDIPASKAANIAEVINVKINMEYKK